MYQYTIWTSPLICLSVEMKSSKLEENGNSVSNVHFPEALHKHSVCYVLILKYESECLLS